MPPFLQNLLALPAKTKALLGVSAVAILAIAFVMLKIATAPSYALIATGLDPAQTGKITAALDEQGIAYELKNNGTALAVQKSSTAQARIALAGQGVSVSGGGTQPGNELLDQSKLGASQFQQQKTAQRALEGEVARTLSGIEGVSNPRVQIVLPQDDLFADESSPATASIMLGNSADTLQPGAVRGMAQLASGAVQGLKTDNVTITDASGAILWPSADSGSGGTNSKQSAEARYARQMESTINAMLASTLGPGKAQVKVNADLNMDETTQKELTYGDKGVPLKSTVDNETLTGAGAAKASGKAGTGSNVPTYSNGTGANAGGAGNYKSKKGSTEFGVNKKVTDTKIAGGSVNKLNVAMIVDKSVPPAVFNQLKSTVSAAAGLNSARGDTIFAQQMAFAKPVTPKAGPVPTTMLGPIKWVGLGLASLLFLFFMTRGLKKREGENLGTPAWLTTIEEPMSLAQLEARTQSNYIDNAASAMLPPRVPDASLHQLDQLMEREPERVAAQVKAWMAED